MATLCLLGVSATKALFRASWKKLIFVWRIDFSNYTWSYFSEESSSSVGLCSPCRVCISGRWALLADPLLVCWLDLKKPLVMVSKKPEATAAPPIKLLSSKLSWCAFYSALCDFMALERISSSVGSSAISLQILIPFWGSDEGGRFVRMDSRVGSSPR